MKNEVWIEGDWKDLSNEVIQQLLDELPKLGLEVLVNPIEKENENGELTGEWIKDEDDSYIGHDHRHILIRPETIVETTAELFTRGYDGYTEIKTFSLDKVDFLKETLEFFNLKNHEKASSWKKEWNKILEKEPSAQLEDYIEEITGGAIGYDSYLIDGCAMYCDKSERLYLYVAWENYVI